MPLAALEWASLPHPVSGTALEVQFRRLLTCCQQHLASSAVTPVGPGKLKSYVDTLQEQLADLRRTLDSPGVLELYQEAVSALSSQLPKQQPPPFCRNLISSHTRALVPGPAASTNYLTPPRPAAPPTELRSYATPSVPSTSKGGISASTSDMLQQHDRLQDHLTDEMVEMAGQMRRRAMGLQDAVQRRDQLLDDTDAALQDSVAGAKVSVAKAKEQYKRSRGSLCFTLLLLMTVALVFAGMVVYIKTSYVFGYRAHKSTPWIRSKGREEL